MVTIGQLLREKGGQAWCVQPESSLNEALELMSEKDIGAVLVIDQQGKVVGIFSERDFARVAVAEKKCSMEDPVEKMMTETVYYVSPEQTIDECMVLMTQKHIRHLPVMENDRLAGVISIGDIVKASISEKDITIRGLENFILGREYSG